MNEKYKKDYVDFLKGFLDIKKPLKVVCDASNGPAGLIIKDLFQASLVEVVMINNNVDPDFSAHGPNPLAAGASSMIIQTIKDTGADLGVMFDADADRAVFVTDKGDVLDSCYAIAFMFGYLNTPIVVDELVYQAIRFLKLIPIENLIPSRIGAFFIKQKVREHQVLGGGEFSGHFFFKDFFNADSGIFACIFFLNALSRMKETVSFWKEKLPIHNIITIEIGTQGVNMNSVLSSLKERYSLDAKEISERDGLSLIFSDYWCNVRASNTEPIVRIIAGGDNNVKNRIKEIHQLILHTK